MNILIAPIKTEKAVGKIEFANTLTFEVSMDSDKQSIKQEIEKLFGVKVQNVKTFITSRGKKRALIKLAKESKAEDIAVKLKMVT
ncbi:MAG TPA: 50S ribosomal protein L23 [Candidatus Bilamarchaeaceae archaeon]|nr:50S ribosomal protein L23 [Candidatus Bilamarchaeaceae archaeon]